MRNNKNKEIAVFGGGCFWCTEAVFKSLKGVNEVKPGYAGGTIEKPSYEQVSTGETGHAEVIYIEYNPAEIAYKDLLTVFFASHDPTTLNRQGADVGRQYRSIVLYTTPEQKTVVEEMIRDIDSSSETGDPVVTEVIPLKNFYDAEDYHKNYYDRNKNKNPYCQLVINPKLEKVQKEFSNLLKQHKE